MPCSVAANAAGATASEDDDASASRAICAAFRDGPTAAVALLTALFFGADAAATGAKRREATQRADMSEGLATSARRRVRATDEDE